MAEIFGGHLAARYLKQVEGVDTVFTLSGGHIENLLDGLTEYGIRAVDVRHEQAAAMMAHAWSIYTGKPGVCLVTAGPGFTNAITGVANAFLDNAPLVMLCGRHPLRDDLTGALQEMNQIDVIKPITKWAATCYETRRILEYLALAFRNATLGRPGPVFLELPPDILFASVEDEETPLPQRKLMEVRTRPGETELREAAALINGANKPVLLGGNGVGMSGCATELARFIEKAGIPFALFGAGRGALTDDHPLCLIEGGFAGLVTSLQQADVVVAVGIRLNWVLQSGKLFPNARVVRIDIDPTEIDRNREADAALTGDAGAVLDGLFPLLEQQEHSRWVEDLKTASKAFNTSELAAQNNPSDPIHPLRLVARIRDFFGPEAYYVSDGGDTNYYGMVGFRSALPAGVSNPAGGLLGCLGTGIPFALSAKLAHPDKPVVLFQGDGSFGFNAMEFDTAVRHDIPIICVVNNDCAWGMIKHAQIMSMGENRSTCAELGLRNYEKVVEGLGGYGELVTKDEDIVPALERAVESGKPACINVVTDPSVTSPATVLIYQSLSGF